MKHPQLVAFFKGTEAEYDNLGNEFVLLVLDMAAKVREHFNIPEGAIESAHVLPQLYE